MVVMLWQDFWDMEIHLCLETLQGYVPYFIRMMKVVVVASERPVIQTFNVAFEDVRNRSWKTLIKKKQYRLYAGNPYPTVKKACSFERIYFSRGSDAEIYQERKNLGRLICQQFLAL
jgi:amidophosphoribosyltransferase